MKISLNSIIKSMNKEKFKYEEDYFITYLPKRLEKFTSQDIRRVKNWFWGWFKYLNKFVDLKNGNNRKVLEVGCAIGAFSSILKEHNFDVYASDISSYVINYARKFWPEIKFFKFDIQEEIPINEQFDIIFAFEVLEHLKNPQKALENMRKRLSLNGTLICSTPPAYKRFANIRGHINVKSAQGWRNILEEVGFQKNMIEIKQVTFIPFLYRYFKKLSLAIPIRINLPYFNVSIFLIARR